jgi:cytochrome P450
MTLVRERTASPQRDLISELAHIRLPSGACMDRAQVVCTATFLFNAGQVTTAPVLRQVLRTLHDGGTTVRDAAVVEEIVRLHPPQALAPRYARTDTALDGQPIEEGSKLVISLPDVNRDPSVFVDPERYAPARTPNPHLSFGFGRHYCLGAGLARQLVAVVIDVARQRSFS